MWVAESKVKDLSSLQWFVYDGKVPVRLGRDKEFNQKHPAIVMPGELVGLKKAARGPGAGNYQLVLGRALHVLFRNVPLKQIEKLGKLKPHRGKTPEHSQVLEGRKRTTRVTIREKATSDKLKDDLYKPNEAVRETSRYDREHYQWRKVTKPGVSIKSLKQGRSKYKTQEDDVIGLRYLTKARGGFVILPDDQRVNISHDTYMELVGSARILPTSRQRKGIVILADVKANLPKQTRVRKSREPVEPSIIRPASGVKTRNPKTKYGIKPDDLHDEGVIGDFEDDELDDAPEAPETPKVPEAHTPSKQLKVGSVIQSARRDENQFVVVESKDYDSYTEFSLFRLRDGVCMKLRLPNNTDLTRSSSIIILEPASPAIMSEAKKEMAKAVKEKSFTFGTIHDK